MNRVDWLLLDLNSFFASCEQQRRPELRGKPLAVTPSITNFSTILAASYEAKKYGVKTGTLVGEARKMCPGIQFVETHHRLYLEYHEKILRAVDEIIPIHSVLSVDEVACELWGTQKNLTVAIELAQRLKKHIQQTVGECLTSSVGLGPNTLIAKIASDMQKPDGLVWILKSEIHEKLGPLSIRDVPGIGARMEERLNQRGIHKIADMLDLSEARVRALWGSIIGSKTLQGLKGEPYVYQIGKTKTLGHEHVLPPDLRKSEAAYNVALKLLNKSCVRLRKNNYRCGCLNLYIKFMGDNRVEKSIRFQKTSDTGFLMKQLQKMWQLPLNEKPLRVSIVLSDLEMASDYQLSFFDQDLSRRENAYKAADRLNERFGHNTIFAANLLSTKSKALGGIAFSRVPSKDEFEPEES